MPSAKPLTLASHLDELRVHVICARLGHGRQRIGRDNPRPGRNAGVASFTFAAQISKRIVNNVNLGGRVQCSHSRIAVAAENDGSHVARPRTVADKPHAKGRLPARRLRLKELDDDSDCGDFAGR